MANEIIIEGPIGLTEEGQGMKASEFKMLLSECDPSKELRIRINSEGGSVFEGIAIYDAIAAWPGSKVASIESAAFSIASYIAMACDRIEITENGYLMIHNPYQDTCGDDLEHEKVATILRDLKESMIRAYARKSGMNPEQVAALMQSTTFMNAETAQKCGFVDLVNMPKVIARSRVFAKSKQMPPTVFASLFGDGLVGGDKPDSEQEKIMSSPTPAAATLAEIKAAFPRAKSEFIIQCLEKNLPFANVAVEAFASAMEKIDALEAELAMVKDEQAKALALKAAKGELGADSSVVEEEQEDEPPVAQAKRRGVAPVAKAKTVHGVSAKAQWQAKFNEKLATVSDRMKAAQLVNVENPGLREKMLEEVNAR